MSENTVSRKMFVNFPVADLDRSKAFFESLGFSFNPQFTDSTAACMVISEENFAMLLTREKFASFSPQPISDAKTQTEVLTCLSCNSREEVDQLVAKALEGGASTFNEPQDHGFMYSHAFQDLDGHVWELMWMDPGALQSQ